MKLTRTHDYCCYDAWLHHICRTQQSQTVWVVQDKLFFPLVPTFQSSPVHCALMNILQKYIFQLWEAHTPILQYLSIGIPIFEMQKWKSCEDSENLLNIHLWYMSNSVSHMCVLWSSSPCCLVVPNILVVLRHISCCLILHGDRRVYVWILGHFTSNLQSWWPSCYCWKIVSNSRSMLASFFSLFSWIADD